MRQFLLFSLLFFGVLTGSTAQTRPDLVYKLDQTYFSAYVDEIGENEITYFLPSDTQKKRPQRVSKAQVWKVVFANGDTELFNEPRQAVISPAPPQKAAVPDRIYLKSKSIVEGSITKISEKSVEYRRLGTPPNSPVYELSREKIQKIEYGNGEIESFEKAPAKSKAIARTEKPSKTPKVKSTVKPPKKEITQRVPKDKSIRTKSPKEREFLSFTVGGDINYMINTRSWTADSAKTGFRQGVGGSVVMDIHPAKWLAFSLRGGLYRYEVERHFLDTEGTLNFKTQTSFQHIPIHLGVKLYPYRRFYVMPEGGIHLVQYNYEDGSPLSEQTAVQRIGYGGSIGTEFGGRTLWFDLSAKYHLLQVNTLGQSFSEAGPIHYVGLRLGVGFMIRKK